MRAVRGVGAMVVLALFGLVLWGGPVTSLWERTFARPCPAEGSVSDCLLTTPGRVESRFDDYAEGDVQLSLTIPAAPGDTYMVVTPEASDRMGIYWESHDVPVTATMLNDRVVALTGPTGVTEESMGGVLDAFFMLLLTGAAAVFVVAGAGLLWRRVRGGEPGWIRRAVVCATVGILVGAFTGRAFGALGVAWIMPVTFAAVVVVSLAATLVRLPRAWTNAWSGPEPARRVVLDPAPQPPSA